MGNIVTGNYGGFVYANSPQGSGSVGALNTATVGPITRSNSFEGDAAKGVAQLTTVGGCLLSVVCTEAVNGVGVGYNWNTFVTKEPYKQSDFIGDVLGSSIGLGFGKVFVAPISSAASSLEKKIYNATEFIVDWASGKIITDLVQRAQPALQKPLFKKDEK